MATGKNTTPLYEQALENLLERIEAGEFKPGDKLPSERELSDELGINRMTLRQALGLLEQQGLVERRVGAGTFVSEPKVEREADSLFQFTKHLSGRGFDTGARVVFAETRPARKGIAERLQMPEGSPVYYGRRLRLIAGVPMMLEKYYLPVVLYPGFERFDLAVRSLYDIIHADYGIRIAHAELVYEAVSASEYEAGLLGVADGAALMRETRVAYNDADQPVEVGIDLYRGDRFKFSARKALPPQVG